MSESEMQKILAVIAHEARLQRSLAIKRGIQHMRTKNGTLLAYEIKNSGHRTAYIRIGRGNNEKVTV